MPFYGPKVLPLAVITLLGACTEPPSLAPSSSSPPPESVAEAGGRDNGASAAAPEPANPIATKPLVPRPIRITLADLPSPLLPKVPVNRRG